MRQILPDIYTVEGLRAGRVYVIKNQEGVTLIDTSLPGSAPKIAEELQKIGCQLRDVRNILITHAHADHIGSIQAIKEASGATVYAHRNYESAVIRGEKKPLLPSPDQLSGFYRLVAPKKAPDFPISTVDVEFEEGDRFEHILPGLEVINTPGHSPGHTSFWEPTRGLLFAGDAIVNIPFSLNRPVPMFTPDMAEAERSILKLSQLPIRTLCMGHGQPYIDNAGPALQAFVDKKIKPKLALHA